MSRHITVYGPSKTQKLVIMSERRHIELSVANIRSHFALEATMFTLHPLTLSGEQVKIEVVPTSTGEDGYFLDHEYCQFYKVRANNLGAGSFEAPISLDSDPDESSIPVRSVIEMIRTLPKKSNLFQSLSQIKQIFRVNELPLLYDGYVAYELPAAIGMVGMEQRYDSHLWTEYVTCSSDLFLGAVRFSRCSGHLRCVNVDCPYYIRSKICNEVHWKGRLSKSPPCGLISHEYGNLSCMHCSQAPECIAICPAVIYYCLPKDKLSVTRCVIHLGEHKHPCREGRCRETESEIDELLHKRASLDPFTTAKQLERMATQDIIMNKLVSEDHVVSDAMGDDEFASFLDTITPLSNKRRIERTLETAKKLKNITSKGLEAVLDLKSKSRYPYIQSVLFPGQLGTNQQPHVFKMSVKGPGSGVDLVNRMRPGGNLENMWVHFDHVHRVKGWPTMSAHVYDPFVRELMTIATCEFTVENKYAQIEFWKMLNKIVIDSGYEEPVFRGFMADEANANWIAVRTVYFGGAKNVTPSKERSCAFHWEQSMIKHTTRCIRPSSQEDHKMLCRKWRCAASENQADICKGELRRFWTAGHAIQDEIPGLETWLAWWDVRVSHWGTRFLSHDETGVFVPNTNLSETKHASMRASVGYKENLNLYEAAGADMAMAVLQSVKYNAYLKGVRTFAGPGLENLASRFMQHSAGTSNTKVLSDYANSSMEEMGFNSPEMNRNSTREKSIRRKRPIFVDADVQLDEDSHRPEFVTQTVGASGSQKQRDAAHDVTNSWHEISVAKSMWAIRRTDRGSKVTCFGMVGEQRDRCGRFINENSSDVKNGVPAPCFWGRRQYPSSNSNPGGVREGFIWFCNTNNTHTWNVHEMVVGPPGPAPGVWPVAEGTTLTSQEVQHLQASGFVLSGNSEGVKNDKDVRSMTRLPSAFRPKYREGKAVKWRSKVTKEFQSRIDLGRTMSAEVVKEVIIVCNESHVFYVNTEGSRAKGINYSVTLSDFPRCTCEDFQKRESKKLGYMPCKHLYFVFLQVLGLDQMAHEFIHQAALTKVELYQALGGTRINNQR